MTQQFSDASSLERLAEAEVEAFMHEYDRCADGKASGGEFTARMYFKGTVELFLSLREHWKSERAEAIKAREAAEQFTMQVHAALKTALSDRDRAEAEAARLRASNVELQDLLNKYGHDVG